ncbi:MAG TPA: hypothetical protein DD405_06945 [Desulfobacteraceae bacterium]|nr:hypothetical protein [Desulfobacteraceae bacterium]
MAEPIGSKAISAGIAEKHILSSEIWNNHPCCVPGQIYSQIPGRCSGIFRSPHGCRAVHRKRT